MQQTLILCVTNREPVPEFKQVVAALRQRGAIYVQADGYTDIARGRSVALTRAAEAMREHGKDLLLCLDDDMAIQPDDAQALVTTARVSGEACSAIYGQAPTEANEKGHTALAGCRVPGTKRWLMGFGCLAVPAAQLFELERTSEEFELHGRRYREFCWSRAEGGEWISEDYRFCKRLGGVQLLPLAAGHKKPILIWPEEETIEEIRRLNDGGN